MYGSVLANFIDCMTTWGNDAINAWQPQIGCRIMVAVVCIFCEFKAKMQQQNVQQYALCAA